MTLTFLSYHLSFPSARITGLCHHLLCTRAGYWTWGPVHTRQALYWLRYTPNPNPLDGKSYRHVMAFIPLTLFILYWLCWIFHFFKYQLWNRFCFNSLKTLVGIFFSLGLYWNYWVSQGDLTSWKILSCSAQKHDLLLHMFSKDLSMLITSPSLDPSYLSAHIHHYKSTKTTCQVQRFYDMKSNSNFSAFISCIISSWHIWSILSWKKHIPLASWIPWLSFNPWSSPSQGH